MVKNAFEVSRTCRSRIQGLTARSLENVFPGIAEQFQVHHWKARGRLTYILSVLREDFALKPFLHGEKRV